MQKHILLKRKLVIIAFVAISIFISLPPFHDRRNDHTSALADLNSNSQNTTGQSTPKKVVASVSPPSANSPVDPNTLSGSALPAKQVGISINGLANMPESQIKAKFDDIAKLGFTSLRIDFPWYDIQPNSPSSFNWANYDKIVRIAGQDRLTILGILDYTPVWARDPRCLSELTCPPSNNGQFSLFAGLASERYKSTVSQWEIWNEENTDDFWALPPNAHDYVSLLKPTYQAIKQKNPAATVIVGGMSSTSSFPNGNIDSVQYLRQMYLAGAKGSFDAIAYHPYTYPKTPVDETVKWPKMEVGPESLRSVMVANGDETKQIWITEFGAPTKGPVGSGFVDEAKQAELVSDMYNAIESKSWAGPIFWYTYKDSSVTDTSTRDNFFGLIRADGTPKPAYKVWQQILKR